MRDEGRERGERVRENNAYGSIISDAIISIIIVSGVVHVAYD